MSLKEEIKQLGDAIFLISDDKNARTLSDELKYRDYFQRLMEINKQYNDDQSVKWLLSKMRFDAELWNWELTTPWWEQGYPI